MDLLPKLSVTNNLLYTACMIRKPQTTGFWRGRLPHWEVEDGRYFVTVHLAGAIPPQGLQRIDRLSSDLKMREDQNSRDASLPLMRTIFRDMEVWLDRCDVSTLLRDTQIAEMVVEAIQHRIQTQRWIVYEFVIMPSHIHLFLSVVQGTLKESMEDFKRWTGHQASKLVGLANDRFWQDEWFDHWSRSDEQDERIVKHIQQNPVKAGLVMDFQEWNYGGSK